MIRRIVQRRNAVAGFTLMEMLVTLVLISFATMLMFQTVSYTHLDVYKRQVDTCTALSGGLMSNTRSSVMV